MVISTRYNGVMRLDIQFKYSIFHTSFEVKKNMTSKKSSNMTKAQLEARNQELETALAKLEEKVNGLVKKSVQGSTKAINIKLSETQWQTIAGQYGKQVSLAPFNPTESKYSTPAFTIKATFSATHTGFEEARALIDVAENNLDKSGLLTQ
jgi:hypothetical protein